MHLYLTHHINKDYYGNDNNKNNNENNKNYLELRRLTLHKKWSCPLRISSVNVTKSAAKLHFLCSVKWASQNVNIDRLYVRLSLKNNGYQWLFQGPWNGMKSFIQNRWKEKTFISGCALSEKHIDYDILEIIIWFREACITWLKSMIKKVSKCSVLYNIKFLAIKTTIVTNNIWNKT